MSQLEKKTSVDHRFDIDMDSIRFLNFYCYHIGIDLNIEHDVNGSSHKVCDKYNNKTYKRDQGMKNRPSQI